MTKRSIFYVRRGDLRGMITALDMDAAGLDYVDTDGQTLLHAAAVKTVPLDIALELIRRGIDLNRQDDDGATALHYAVQWLRLDIAHAIVHAGGQVDIEDKHGNQALWYAVGNPHADPSMVELLMRFGSDPTHLNVSVRSTTPYRRLADSSRCCTWQRR